VTTTARILVVDDTPANIRLMSAILETHGYEVRSVANGTEALAAVASETPDLVLLDIRMPGLDGYEVCRRLRDDDATAMLPIIMITASGNEEKVAALDAGADDFVLRPFEQSELLARVRSLLRIKTYHDTITGQAAELAAWNKTLESEVAARVEENQRLEGLRRFLSAHIADVVLTSGNEQLLEPHRREVAIVYGDLRGFTAFSSAAEPEEALGVLQGFHQIVGEYVRKHGATVGFFAGDGVMLCFNDPVPCPDPAMLAVTTACELRDAIASYSVEWRRRGHDLGAGFAVTFGYATLGMLGFEGRYDYSAIGPVVNLASRLCDAAADGEVLIGQRAHAVVEERVVAESRGELNLPGFDKPVPAWNVRGLRNAGSGTTAAPSADGLDVRILGLLEVRNGGSGVDLRAAKERTLLLQLLLHRRRVLSVERLAEDLWDGAPPDGATNGLRVHVSRLRKNLSAAGLGALLETRQQGYRLDIDDECIDAVRFERIAADGRKAFDGGDAERAVELLRSALAMWSGPALADVASAGFATAEAARLEELRLTATEDCIEAELACGRHRQVLGELEALVLTHPLREQMWAHRMLALYRSGRQSDALSAYQLLRGHLDQELGLDPSPELQKLHQSILEHAPELGSLTGV
jgi:adenylate cyclase